MKTPQLENGYVKIANEIMEAFCSYRIPGEQMQCLMVIIRKTYGFNKKEDYISNSQFCDATGIKKPHVCRAINELIKKNIVTKKGNSKIPSYCFNKNYNKWKLLPKKVTVTKKGNSVAKKGNKLLPKMVPTKEKKNNIQKKVCSLFDFWNNQKIITHRDIEKFKPHIKSKLQHYSEDEIKQAIGNYGTVLNSPDFWFTYKWTLKEFLTRDGGFEKFLNVNQPFVNYKRFVNGNDDDGIDVEYDPELEEMRKRRRERGTPDQTPNVPN